MHLPLRDSQEAELGLAADVGTLQRMPRVVGNDSWVRELALTARRASADEVLRFGLVSKVLTDSKALRSHAMEIATRIASLSPVAIRGTKENLNFARDNSVDDALRYQVRLFFPSLGLSVPVLVCPSRHCTVGGYGREMEMAGFVELGAPNVGRLAQSRPGNDGEVNSELHESLESGDCVPGELTMRYTRPDTHTHLHFLHQQ